MGVAGRKRMRFGLVLGAACVVTALLLWALVSAAGDAGEAGGGGDASRIKRDETVVLFDTAARREADGSGWVAPVAGWIFELEEDSVWRGALAESIEAVVGEVTALDEASRAILQRRVRWFLVDNERGKRIAVRLAGRDAVMAGSAKDGHFAGTLTLDADAVAQHAEDGRLPIRVALEAGDARTFEAAVHLIEPTGMSVISDFDDTMKVTQVTDTAALVRNTFLRPFEPVAGMAATYRRWAESGAAFHVVSSSPWQLHEPITAFLREQGFPPAVLHLRRVRVKDAEAVAMLLNGASTKAAAIEAILAAYPQRRFVLVGDNGEQDPEIYADVMRRRPTQIAMILIRNVTNEAPGSMRMHEAFRGIPHTRWRLFSDATELKDIEGW